jgi:RNA polymerase sigma-70 factor (ECF subfamily)
MERDRRLSEEDTSRPASPGPGIGRSVPAAGLSASFEDFYEIEEAALYGALVLITGNRHDAEELKQDAFLRLWERWDLVQGMANPTGYLYRTAMNGFRSRVRRARVAARNVVAPDRGIDAFAAVDARSDLLRALGSLTERQRAAIVLTELLGFSTHEAAETLGVRPATVRKFLSLARDPLRRSMRLEDD